MKPGKIFRPILIFGVGNDYRSDDAVGLYVAREIGSRNISCVSVFEGIADAAALAETWKGGGTVYVFDSVSSKAEPGTIYRFEPINEDLPEDLFDTCSTHTLSLTKSVELARALDMLPDSLIVFGIEGENFAHGQGLSPRVKKAADEMVIKIIREIENRLE